MGDRASGPDGAEQLRRQIVTYSAKALVRSKEPNSIWVRWKDRTQLVVRTASVEIVGWEGRGSRFRSYVFPGQAAAMRHDHIGMFGLPIRTHECLKLRVDDGMQFAVSPEDTAWKALTVAGVHPG